MKTSKLFQLFVVALSAMAFVACEEPTPVTPEDGVEQPTIQIATGEATENTISFAITSTNAEQAAWVVIKSSEATPAALSVLQHGTAIECNASVDCTAKKLNAETEYKIVVAVMNSKYVSMSEATMTTLEFVAPDPDEVVEPRIGDIYYSDGTWSTELDENKTPIGVVFCLGAGKGDAASLYTTKGGEQMTEIKGYVVALVDATKGVNDDEGVVWSFYDGWYNGAGCSSEVDDFLGYSNTAAIKQAALRDDCPAGEFNGTDLSFPAAWYASDGYELMAPSPKTSSGWYLPSIYQFDYLWNKTYFNDGNMLASVEDTLVMLSELGYADEMYVVDSEYWSSTEKYDSYGDSSVAYYFCFDKAMYQPGFGTHLNKYWAVRVRSMLTF